MFIIQCPYCGSRDESEFAYGGEAGIMRPQDPYALSDEAWADYLFMRQNPRGVLSELWCHSAGCRQWFTIRRNTVSNQIELTN